MTTDEEIGSMDCEAEVFKLLNLPILVGLNIFNFLDSKSLRNIRATCASTKSRVDSSPKLIKKLRLHLQDESRIEEIVKSGLNWKNIVIPIDLPISKLNPVLHEFAESLTHIEIVDGTRNKGSPAYDVGVLAILLSLISENLESISIQTLHPQVAGIEDWTDGAGNYTLAAFKTRLENCRDNLKRNLQELRRIEFPGSFSMGREIVHCFISTILDVSENLVELRLPFMSDIQFPNYGRPAESVTHGKEDELCKPLMSYLERIAQSRRSSQLVVIDFGCIWTHGQYFDNVHYYEPVYPITAIILLKMVSMCEKWNLRLQLFNVPSTALPIPAVISRTEKERLNRYIRSIILKGHSDSQLAPIHRFLAPIEKIYIPPDAQINLYIWYLPLIRINPPIVFPSIMNIISVNILCEGGNSSPDLAQIIPTLFPEPIPTVTVLVLRERAHISSSLRIRLQTVFPNVKKLFVSDVSALDCFSETSPFNGLIHLEELNITDCDLTTTNPDVGNSFFQNFKKLSRLTIKGCRTTPHPINIEQTLQDTSVRHFWG